MGDVMMLLMVRSCKVLRAVVSAFCHIFTLQHDSAHDDFCCDVTLIYVRIVLDLIMFLKGEKDKK